MKSNEELRAEMESIKWYHTIDLGNGMTTPGSSYLPERISELRIPADLSGLHVLDIGAWDGGISFECERRNAARVAALDSYVWYTERCGCGRGFDFAKSVLNSGVEKCVCEVQDISPTVGEFDIVIFSQILYHMRHPLLCLERIASVTKPGGLLIMETVIDMLLTDRPAAAFYPSDELCEDFTNWWGVNEPCLVAMLRDVGFGDIDILARHAAIDPASTDPTKSHGRISLHARRSP